MIQKSLGKSRSRIDSITDLGTSPNHHALLGIVAHYTNENGRLNKALLALLKLLGHILERINADALLMWFESTTLKIR